MYTHARDAALRPPCEHSPNDSAWWLALGHSQYGLGNWTAAIRRLRESVALGGVTKRVLWYQWWPVTALNSAGRYAGCDRRGGRRHRQSAPVYAEMRYERAVALHAPGPRRRGQNRIAPQAIGRRPELRPGPRPAGPDQRAVKREAEDVRETSIGVLPCALSLKTNNVTTND